MLSVVACCTDNDCQEGQSYKNELAGKSPVKEKGCAGCSPFFSCGNCAGFVITKTFTPDLKPKIETPANSYKSYAEPYSQQVYLSIWQPPQLS